MPATFSKTRPTEDRLLVELGDCESETDGEVRLVGDNAKNLRLGFVEEVGPGLKQADGTRIPMQFKKGQKILFDKTGCVGFTFECGPTFLLVRESAVYAIMARADEDDDDEGDELE
jgi:chaperonin GroES